MGSILPIVILTELCFSLMGSKLPIVIPMFLISVTPFYITTSRGFYTSFISINSKWNSFPIAILRNNK